MPFSSQIVVHIVEQIIIQQEIPDIDKFIEQRLCSVLPGFLNSTCDLFISIYGPTIITGLLNKENADVICHALPFCDNSPTCHLSPKTKPAMLSPAAIKSSAAYKASSPVALDKNVAKHLDGTVRQTIRDALTEYRMNMLNQEARRKYMEATKSMAQQESAGGFFEDLTGSGGIPHLPLIDLDGDYFSESVLVRGSHWRGRDCRDLDNYIYPGRKQNPYHHTDDYNCNGISGSHATGMSNKDYFCASSKPRGVGVLGDSAGAHFSIPPAWVTPGTINLHTYDNLLAVLNDEFDLPQYSAYTAFEETPAGSLYPLRSVYKELVNRNRCNHRDFQNLAVNGGDSYNVQLYEEAFARNTTLDHPMTLFLELFGNDVCSSAHNWNDATPPAVFKENVVKILNAVDEKLPKGSNVVIFGLVDGRVLYNVLHDKFHPIGGGVTYGDLYDFLNCVHVNPCWGWCQTNATIRNETTRLAMHLNDQIRDLIKETGGKFKNFQAIYYDVPIAELLEEWARMGHAKSELIEAVDGFHPDTYALSLIADWVVKRLDVDMPEALGPVNPFNEQIKKLFGNQGGY